MKYKLSMLFRFLTGLAFCYLYFKGSFKLFIWEIDRRFFIYYITSAVLSSLYLYFSYLVSRYSRRYFFEFRKEFLMKLMLILVMYGSVILLSFLLPAVISIGNKKLIVVYFILIYVAYDFISEVALVTMAYGKSIDMSKYQYTEVKIAQHYMENPNRSYAKIVEESKKFHIKNIFSRWILPPVYDCFVTHNEDCYAFFDKTFYEELLKFSKENQIFYGKKITNENYILDNRCNVVCIAEDNFTFYDHYGRKCIFVNKVINH